MEFLRDRVERLLEDACEFQAQSGQARVKAREQFLEIETEEENVLRMFIDGLIARLAGNMTNKVAETNDKTSYQISLATSYIRTHYVINELILNGDLVEAMTLIRKQLESLTRMNELDSAAFLKLLKKTPNVVNVFKSPGKKIYPHLSEVAHFATPRVGELLHVVDGGDLVGPSLHPKYTKYAHGCFDLHALVTIYFLFWLIEKQKAWYPGVSSEEVMLIASSILDMAMKFGVVVDAGT